MPNYIELIRTFWRSHEEYSFSPTEIALYLYLLEVCNICRWKNPFRRNNAKIEADLSISFYTLRNARNRLKMCGLIDFKTASGSASVVYTLKMGDEVANEVSREVPNEAPDKLSDKVAPTKDKRNKTKTTVSSSPPPPPPAKQLSDRSSSASSSASSPPGCAAPPAEPARPVERLREEFNRRGETFALLVINALRGAGKLSQADVWNWLDRFTGELRARGEETKTTRDYQSHFVNWLKIQLEKQYGNGRNNQRRTGSGTPPPTVGNYTDDL